MRKPLVFLCYTAIAITACQAPTEETPDELIVPLAEVAGSGPFLAGKGALMANRPDSDLTPLYEAVAGLPEGLDSLTIGQWEADFTQWIYQGYHNQRIDSAVAYRWLNDLKAEDTLWYTKENIDVQVSLAFGTNAAGQKVVVVDQNNDEDLADEAVFVFTKQDSLTSVDGPPAAQDSIGVFRVQYERYDGKRIVTDEVVLQINPYLHPRFWTIGRLGYRRGEVTVNNQSYALSVAGNHFLGIGYRPDGLQVIAEDSFPTEYTEKYPRDSVLAYQEMLTLGDERYRIADVSPTGDQLTLRKHPRGEPWYGTQIGALAYPVDTVSITGAPCRVPNQKTVLIDFWGTWCQPCVRETPFLKDAHIFFSGNQFEIVGVARDKLEKLQQFVEVQRISWTQIHQGSDQQEIVERYRINSFPSTFLVNPAGKVIGKNTGLRGHSLIETLTDVLNVPTDTLTHKISRGNVLLTLPGEASDQWLIRADFTQDHPIPLYHLEDRWQRGFDLAPGTYAYTLESYAYNVKPQQGTFTVGDSEELLTVTLSSQIAR